MELNELRALITLLRELGVSKYSGGNVSIELAEKAPGPAERVDLTKAGFAPKPEGADPALTEMLKKLDPRYSDSSLFKIE